MAFAIDCPDALALAEFYAALLGWRVVRDDGDLDWVEVHPAGAQSGGAQSGDAQSGDARAIGSGAHLAFQRVPDYRAPEWPDGHTPQQAHLDFSVADLAAAEAAAIAVGATRHPVQPSQTGSFVVFTDPAGHPFCLCLDSD